MAWPPTAPHFWLHLPHPENFSVWIQLVGASPVALVVKNLPASVCMSVTRSVMSNSLWPHALWPSYAVLQARILEWIAIPFSRGSSRPRDQTQVSWIAGRFFAVWATGKSKLKLKNNCRRHKGHSFDPWVRTLPWRRKWQRTPVFLPGESHGQRSLVGYSPQGCTESDTNEAT